MIHDDNAPEQLRRDLHDERVRADLIQDERDALRAEVSALEAKLEEMRGFKDMAVEAHGIATRHGCDWRDKYEAGQRRIAELEREVAAALDGSHGLSPVRDTNNAIEQARQEGYERGARRSEVIEGLLTIGRLVVRGVPQEHAERCIYLLRDDVETWEREEEKRRNAKPES